VGCILIVLEEILVRGDARHIFFLVLSRSSWSSTCRARSSRHLVLLEEVLDLGLVGLAISRGPLGSPPAAPRCVASSRHRQLSG
jgi:hypothetical protein